MLNLIIMEMLPQRSLQKGQALLVVLLVLAVVLTIAAASVSRSVVGIRITTVQEDSVRAFNAAEAGIEEAILTIPGSIGSSPVTRYLPDNTTYTYSVSQPSGSTNFIYPDDLLPGEVATIWFVTHDSSGQLKCPVSSNTCLTPELLNFYWGDVPTPVNNQTPAIEVIIFYDRRDSDGATKNIVDSQNFNHLKVVREVFDPVSARALSNGFITASNTNFTFDTRAFEFSLTNFYLNGAGSPGVNIPCYATPGCIIAVKVRMLYNLDSSSSPPVVYPQKLAISATNTNSTIFPSQGAQIISEGLSGDATRKVRLFQGYPIPPNVFESVLYSPSDIVK